MSGPGLQLPPSDPRFPILVRLRRPAFMLMAVGVLNILFSLLGLVLALLKVPSPTPPPPGQPPVTLELTLGLGLMIVFTLICGAVTVWGSLNAMRLRGYGLALMGAITAVNPLSPSCVIGIPFTVWMLFTLNQPEVRKAFMA